METESGALNERCDLFASTPLSFIIQLQYPVLRMSKLALPLLQERALFISIAQHDFQVGPVTLQCMVAGTFEHWMMEETGRVNTLPCSGL